MVEFTDEGLDHVSANFYKKQLGQMEEQAPSDSFICSCVEKHGKWYSGVLRLFSSEGEFAAKATSTESMKLCINLLSQFDRAIREWRRDRIVGKTPWPRIVKDPDLKKCSSSDCPLVKALKKSGGAYRASPLVR